MTDGIDARSEDGEDVRVGVIGVGSMGANHARVYRQMPSVSLIGVADADTERGMEIAEQNDTRLLSVEALLESTDAVSVTVPTEYHYEMAGQCIDAGVDVLVEKPFVDDISKGRELARRVADRDVVLQVGHIERFNPAVETALDIASAKEIIAVTSRRLGPPLDRAVGDDVVFDLMIHDIDIVLTLAEEQPESIVAAGYENGRYASAQFTLPDGSVANLTASRLTQRRVRELEITTRDCQIVVDYLDQSLHIHRRSEPEYLREDGELRYRNNSVVEQPIVANEEPLKRELSAFVEASESRTEPPVTAADGIEALRIVGQISSCLDQDNQAQVVPR